MQDITIQFTKLNNKLVPASEKDAQKISLFALGIDEGQIIDVYMNVAEADDASLAQLAKIHAMISEIGRETGHSHQEVKTLIKTRAGLYTIINSNGQRELKSFAHCSKLELSQAIQSGIDIGQVLGINF